MSALRAFPREVFEEESYTPPPLDIVEFAGPNTYPEKVIGTSKVPSWAVMKATTPLEVTRMLHHLAEEGDSLFDYSMASENLLKYIQSTHIYNPVKSYRITNYFIQQMEFFLISFPDEQDTLAILRQLQDWMSNNYSPEVITNIKDENQRTEAMLSITSILMSKGNTPNDAPIFQNIKDQFLQLIGSPSELRLNNQMAIIANLTWQQVAFRGNWIDQWDTFQLFKIFKSIYASDPTTSVPEVQPTHINNYEVSRDDLITKYAINIINVCGNLLLTGDFKPEEVREMVMYAISINPTKIRKQIADQIIPEVETYNRLVPEVYLQFWREVIGIEA